MKKGKGFLTIGLFALAATLLAFSVVSSSQATLQYYSEVYGAEMQIRDIGVTLVENGEAVSNRDYAGSDDRWNGGNGALVSAMLAEGEDLKLGHPYKEELAVHNSGNINEYVRVTIYKYWEKDGKKVPELDSSIIDLKLENIGSAWQEDESARTEERTVLYYTEQLGYEGNPEGLRTTTPAFSSTLTIQDEPVEAAITKRTVSTDADGNTVIETEYTYNGAKFVLRADVDAVQTHNVEDAMMSAWGTMG